MKGFVLRTALLAVLLQVSGCGDKSNIIAREDPAYVVDKTQPTAIVVAENASIQDRQLLPLLKARMQAKQFNLVDLVDAQRVIGFGGGTAAVFVGTSTYSQVIPVFGTAIATSHSKADYQDVGTVHLTTFDGDQFRAGKTLPLWEGTISVESDVFKERQTVVVDTLLDSYGRDFEDDSYRLPRSTAAR